MNLDDNERQDDIETGVPEDATGSIASVMSNEIQNINEDSAASSEYSYAAEETKSEASTNSYLKSEDNQFGTEHDAKPFEELLKKIPPSLKRVVRDRIEETGIGFFEMGIRQPEKVDPYEFPLHYACNVVHFACESSEAALRVIKGLVEDDGYREHLLQPDHQNRLPLHWACSHDTDAQVIEYLLRAQTTNGQNGKEALYHEDSSGHFPFHLAVISAPLSIIEYLHRQSSYRASDPLAQKQNIRKESPLHYACRKDVSLEVIQFLIKVASETLLLPDYMGNCPLHLSCQYGNSFEVIKCLVGEDENGTGKKALLLQNFRGYYPLHVVCMTTQMEWIRYLAKEADGAVLLLPNYDGDLPLHLACHSPVNIEKIRFLVEAEESALHYKNKSGRYPLHIACRSCKGPPFDVIQYLVKQSQTEVAGHDVSNSTPFELMPRQHRRAMLSVYSSHRTSGITDAPSEVDRLNYLVYARALAHTARQTELSGSSLCVGLYGRWGAGKTTLWKQTKKCLRAEFLLEDVTTLYKAQNSRMEYTNFDNTKNISAFHTAVKNLIRDEYVPHAAKEAWRGELNDSKFDLSSFERLLCSFILLSECLFRPTSRFFSESEYENETPDQNRCRRRLLNEQARRDERLTQWFLLFFIPLAPVLLFIVLGSERIHWLSCRLEKKHRVAQSRRIRRILAGDTPLANGHAYQWNVCDVLSCLVVVPLHCMLVAYRTIASIFAFVMTSFQQDSNPIGATAYEVVEFNAWEYQGSDLLWASLIKKIWDAVEKRYGKSSVRYHRASIALAGETPFNKTDLYLSVDERTEKRKRALFIFRIRFVFFTVIFFSVLGVCMNFLIPEARHNSEQKLTSNETDASNLKTSTNSVTLDDLTLIRSMVLIVAASIPIITQIVTFFSKVFPYLRRTQGESIFLKATSAPERRDFKEELGLMGEVKTEVEYLFDLLSTEAYLDNDIGCMRYLRLCVFIDDLDRCPDEIVVQVLEAIILLLVDGPISVWVAIDSRIVVKCIEAVKKEVFDKANISGHEFLDKIIQMPFSLPAISNGSKDTYLDKMIESQGLEPTTLLSRVIDSNKMVRDYYDPRYDPYSLSNLATIARAMYASGVIEESSRRISDCGMTENDLIDLVEKRQHQATTEDKENFCSMIAENISRIRELPDTSMEDIASKYDMKRRKFNFALERKKRSKFGFEKFDFEDRRRRQRDTNENDDLNIYSYLNVLRAGEEIYVPMLSDLERTSLRAFIPFIIGNPRKMKRIINVFNVSRHIAESKFGSAPKNRIEDEFEKFTPKLLKFNILLEQWPYRMAWVLQFIEDVEQISAHGIHEGVQGVILKLLKENFPGKFEGGQDDMGPMELIKEISIMDLYEKVIHDMMWKSSRDNVKGLFIIDSDPKLFSGLLNEKKYKMTVEDFASPRSDAPNLLRNYAFNASHFITDQVAILLGNALQEVAQSTSNQSPDQSTE